MPSETATNELAMLCGEADAEQFLQCGIIYSTGRSVAADRVSAHK
jgi:hypothetical protein